MIDQRHGGFARVENRDMVAAFDSGAITSDFQSGSQH